jgi:hypothetical protein
MGNDFFMLKGVDVMAVPRSVTRVDRAGGVTFTSSVDRVQYTINELSRAALRDTAKMLRKKMIIKLKTLPGMKRNKRIYKIVQVWVRKEEADLQIGFGNTKTGVSGQTWYGIGQELGAPIVVSKQRISVTSKKFGFLRGTVFENIGEIRNIQAQYISAIDDEQRALRLIDESELTTDGVEE